MTGGSQRGMTDASAEQHLVVVGSSAGGIEALSVLVAGLPGDFRAPIILAQHLDPHRSSHLAEILGRRSALPVVSIDEHGDLAPGTVYVVPADRHVEVTDHAVRLVERDDSNAVAPSVDRLMATAADVFGERLIAVVLTGTGSDGADGARRVKQAGGTVVIQDPGEARFPSMPESLEPTVVDLVVRLDALGPLLHDLVRGAYRPVGSEDDRVLERFLASLRERTGIDFSRYKRETILRRLQGRMAAVRRQRLGEYVRYVGDHPDEYQRLVSAFLIKVTDFFRDPELFEYLRTTVLPPMIEGARKRDRELRIWCAGCATGEEPYSLAILLSDLLGDEVDDWTVRIFATDLDPDAVAFARRGRYRTSTVETLGQEVLGRHFTRMDGQYEVRKHLRAMTVFGEHDLALRSPFPRIDLAFCRNVLIYFTPELQSRALRLFAFSVRPGGFLVLGKAESTAPLPEFFDTHEARLRIVRRRDTLAPVPAAQVPRITPMAPRLGTMARRAQEPDPARGIARSTGEEDGLLGALPMGLVLVDARYAIRSMNAAARRMLGIYGAATGEDLLHLVERLPAGELRSLIDLALRGRSERRVLPLLGRPGPGETEVFVEVVADPMAAGPDRQAVLTVRDAPVPPVIEGEAVDEEGSSLEARLRVARDVNRRLLRDNEELAAANAQLLAANEEMLIAQEEAQAATEEVETLNEELQATNEELETLNEELQATVEELNTTGEDMQARAVELQLLATHLDEQRKVSETERLRFELLIESLADAVALIDARGATIIRNEAWIELVEQEGFEPIVEEGQPITSQEMRQRVAAGEQFTVQFAARRGGEQRRWFEASGLPVPPEMGTGGGILVLHDTTDLSLRRLQEDFVAIVAHELRTPLTALRGYVGLMRRQSGHGTDMNDRLLALTEEQAERLTHLVEELFDVTRAETGRLQVSRQPTSLREVVESTVEIAQSLSDQQIKVEAFDDSLVEIDGPRMQQVLLNILTNAQRHAETSPTVSLRIRRQRRWLVMEVEDHGPGMSDRVRESLFSRFHVDPSSPGHGLGLGLYISRQIVLAHGGTIEADSAPGEGTTFTIRLPISAVVRAAGHDAGKSDGRDGSNGSDRRSAG
jgi:two-component system CheB/CheR fusion protein